MPKETCLRNVGFIDRPQLVWWRRALFQVHLWVGIALGAYAVAIGVSGSAIVFADRISDDVQAAPRAVLAEKPLPLGRLVSIARSQDPGFTRPTQILANYPTQGLYVVQLAGTSTASRYVYLSGSGRVLGDVSDRAPNHAAVNWLTNLHVNLLGGDTGTLANGIFGAGLALLAFSGIVVWWPGRKNWRRAVTITVKSGTKRLFFDVHSTVGFWTFGLVAMFALTGVALVFFQPWTNMLTRLFANGPVQPVATTSSWAPGTPMKPLDRFVERASALNPGLRWDFIDFPTLVGGALIVRLTQPNVPLRLARHAFVYFDPATARVLERQGGGDGGVVDSINWYVVEGLHFGDYTVWSQCVWVIIGLAPALLAITSSVLWWNRLMRWRTTRAKRESASARSLRALLLGTLGEDWQ